MRSTSSGQRSVVDYDAVDRLQSDQSLWNMALISDNLAVKHQTVREWRHRSLAHTAAGERLPLVQDVLPMADGGRDGNKPLWRAGTIRRWAMRVGRMDMDGAPKRFRGEA